jgi:acyl dehydratase
MTAEVFPVAVGDLVPPFTVALTLQRLVMEAAANRDFAPIHFDREAAAASGAPDVYANTTFIETLLEAALRSWAGPTARIAEIGFTMRDFNCVGDEVSAGGAVTGTREAGDELEVELDIWVESHRGRTTTGRAVVLVPGRRV